MKLTQQQLNHFNTFGFVVFRQLPVSGWNAAVQSRIR